MLVCRFFISNRAFTRELQRKLQGQPLRLSDIGAVDTKPR